MIDRDELPRDAPVEPLEDDPLVRRHLEIATPEPRPRWRSELGATLAAESHRRAAVRPRPPYLWARAGTFVMVGLVLLALALGQV